MLPPCLALIRRLYVLGTKIRSLIRNPNNRVQNKEYEYSYFGFWVMDFRIRPSPRKDTPHPIPEVTDREEGILLREEQHDECDVAEDEYQAFPSTEFATGVSRQPSQHDATHVQSYFSEYVKQS